MYLQFSVIAFFLTLSHWSFAQLPFPRQCPEVKIMDSFDLDAYMGVWYEYSKYPFVFEIGKKCMYARYENLGNGTVAVMNAAINRFTGSISNVTGTAKVIAPAQLAVQFSPNRNVDKPNYLVLGTDYTNYTVVYSCANFTSLAHTKIVWILTRHRKPSAETITAAKQVMEDNKLIQAFLIDTEQNDCPNLNDESSTDSPDMNIGASSVDITTLNPEQSNLIGEA